MAFFTSDMELGEAFGNPKPSQAYQPTVGAGPLAGARAVGGDPLSLFAQAISQGGRPQGLGSGMDLSGVGNLDFGGIGTTGGAGTGDWLGQPGSPDATMPWMPSTGQQPVAGGDDSFPGDDGITSGSEIDLRDYLENRGMYQHGLNLFGSLMGVPMLGALADYGAGINPLAGITGNVFLDSAEDKYGLTPDYFGGVDYGDLSGYQRDFLTEQIMFDAPSLAEREEGLFGGFFDNLFGDGYNDISLGYDRDLDLTLGPWEETRPLTLDELAAMGSRIDDSFGTTDGAQGWGNNYLDAGFTQEDVDFIESGFDDDDSGSDDSGGFGDSYGGGDYGGYDDAQAEADMGW